ncbi:MAG: prolipoprotein diacylglyceryl transferase [Thermodesulfobacteriota bacterium]
MHPILFRYGPITIRYYGLMYVIAIVVGSFLIKSEVRRKRISLSDDEVMNFIVWAVVAGVIGARLYYIAFNLPYYISNPAEIPAVWHGGLAIHGGLTGGALASYIYLKRKGVSFWRMADAVAPAAILGQTFGRFGNFMNGDAHGSPTDLPWGMVFPPQSIAGSQFPGIPLHPTMLYELVLNFMIFCFLWFFLRKKGHRNGYIFAMYIMLYSAGRFFVEHFRADSLMFGPIRVAQAVSIAIVVAAAVVIFSKKLWKADEGRP